MEWEKQLIEINNLPVLRDQLNAQIKTANPRVNHIRCIFGYKDNPMVYAYTVFDFLDNYQNILNQGQIEKFYIYQLIEKKSIS